MWVEIVGALYILTGVGILGFAVCACVNNFDDNTTL